MKHSTEASAKGRSRREIVIGALFTIIGLLVVIPLPLGTWGERSTFALISQRGGITIDAPDLEVPTAASLYVLGALAIAAGVWQLVRGFRRVNLMVGLVAGLAIAAFLVWASYR